MTATPAITLSRLSRLYGNFAALRDLSLVIAPGESVALFGENGAGKSTLLRIIAGLASASYGTVSVFGAQPLDIRERIAYMSHSTMLYDELTARENLEYFAALYVGEARLTPVDSALESVGLDPGNSRRVGEYSQGMRQRAALARTLMTQPDLLLLDEPFSNLDVPSADRMIACLKAFLDEPGARELPRTLILTTHQHALAAPLVTRTITLKGGRILSDEATP